MGTAAGRTETGNPAADPRGWAFTRLAEEVCQSREPGEMARGCAALRDHVLEQCEQGALTPAAAREICRAVDDVLEDALRRLGGQPPLPGADDAQEKRLRRAQQLSSR